MLQKREQAPNCGSNEEEKKNTRESLATGWRTRMFSGITVIQITKDKGSDTVQQ
jgi:hypothetical protein